MNGFATAEGTWRYAARFAGRLADGNFREVPPGNPCPIDLARYGVDLSEYEHSIPRVRESLLLSSIGIGTYLGEANEETDRGYTEAVVAAVERGANVIDTAINYRLQRSERSIRDALVELARRGFARQELVLCTKGGYLTPDGQMPVDAAAYFRWEYIERGVLRREDVAAGCHAMSPRYLEDQIGRSLRNLGVECIDVYYLHNPETQLGEVSREEFLHRIRAAFGMLEAAVAAGKIRFYGVATWNGFRQPQTAQDFLSLSELEAAAREAGGARHHFRFVQLPFNLAMTEALTRANQRVSDTAGQGEDLPMVRAAQSLGITLVASASLLQGKVTRNLPPFVAQALGLENDTQRALQFARSAPGIATALVGMSHAEHVAANLKFAETPPASAEQFARLFERREGA